MGFCHIAPTNYLSLVEGRPQHLVLAHLIEQDEVYRDFYKKESVNDSTIIMDNSAFEMYKQNKPMYDSSKLIDLAGKVGARYIALSDYPGQPSEVTIKAAEELAPKVREAGYGTFFIPQSSIGDWQDLVDCFFWASKSPLVDYIGYSILAIPNAFAVEKNNKLQRYVSRAFFIQVLRNHGYFEHAQNKKHHFLGMVDGPNEIALIDDLIPIPLDTWDSSAAVWAGLNDIMFDTTPTGLVNGKYEAEVDFQLESGRDTAAAEFNMSYIDQLWDKI